MRKHVFKLHHASGAASGHNLGARGYHVVALALTNLAREVIVEEVERTTAAAATVGLGHFRNLVGRVGRNDGTGLADHTQRFLEVARIVIGHAYRVVLRLFGGLHLEHIHQEGVDVHGLGRKFFDLAFFNRTEAVRVAGPQFLDRRGTGTAGAQNVVEVAVFKGFHVHAHLLHHALGIAGRKRRNTAAGEVFGHKHGHIVVTQHLHAGFGHFNVHLVAHATGEESHLKPASAAGFVKRAIAGVQGLFCQRVNVAVAQHKVEQGCAHSALSVVA